ncbi:MAG: acyltransferase family protein [Actinomycetes bacterium]
MTGESTSTDGVRETSEKRVLRPEIQALRAIAVVTVVIFHYWPHLISGGYIGVDVFFAISGFLITGHLVREVDSSGRVSLPGFWARRARRILPAALLVLLFCAVATYLIVPLNLWDQFFREIQASTLYVENWNLAREAVDYLGAENRPSPVQHYWSLSVEEQFYIVWPVLILIAMLFVRNGSAAVRRRAITTMLALLTAASLTYSIWHTANDPAAAFFVTPTRVWEFGAGGLLAIFAASAARPAIRAAVSWIGVAMILVAAFAYSPDTPFPGAAAILPIAGTLAVIWAGSPELRWSPWHWMKLRGTQWLGNVSYSVYLWHWPLLILTPFLVLSGLTTPIKIGLLALTLLLAALSKRFVEDPLRSGPFLASHKPRRSFVFVLLGTGTVLLATFGALAVLSARQDADTLATAKLFGSHERCLGAAARDPEHQPCINPKLRLAVSPTPLELRRDYVGALNADFAGPLDSTSCPAGGRRRVGVIRSCTFGVPPDQAKRSVAIIGDSHAGRWRAGMTIIAKQRKWSVVGTSLLGCPFSAVTYLKKVVDPVECAKWRKDIPGWLASMPKVDTLFVAQLSHRFTTKAQFETDVAGFQEQWRRLPPTIKHIIVLLDNPKALISTLDCVERAINAKQPAGPACALSREDVLTTFPDTAATAALRLHKPNIGVIDLTDFYCDKTLCYPVIGGVLVISDRSHITPLFNSTLVPYALRALDRGKWMDR